MHFRSLSLASLVCLSTTTNAYIVPHSVAKEGPFIRTGSPVSGITYSNYDTNPTAATVANSNNPATTNEPFSARGELIDPSASLKREDILISPPVPTSTTASTPRVIPTATVTRGHPVDEVGVRMWRETIAPPARYYSQPAAFVPSSVVEVEPAEPTSRTPTTPASQPTSPEKAAFQQAEMDRWTQAAHLMEQKKLERQAKKESFQKEEMLRWTEAAKRDAHAKTNKKSTSSNKKSSRKKNNSSSRNGKK